MDLAAERVRRMSDSSKVDPTAVASPASAGSAAPGRLFGRLESVNSTGIAGWAASAVRPDTPTELELLIDDAAVGCFPADHLRPDLAGAYGDGRCGFAIRIPAGLARHRDRRIAIRRAEDQAELPGSPFTLPREVLAGKAAQRTIADAVEAAVQSADGEALEALLRHLAGRIADSLPAPPPHHAALLARWGANVPRVPAPRGVAPRVLIIDEGVPDPAKDAGSNALLSHMRALCRLGWQVEFVPAWSVDLPADGRAAVLAGLGVRVWHAPWIDSVEEVLRRLGPQLDAVYVHRLAVMTKYGALVRRWCPRARLIYLLADLHSLRLARQRAVETGTPDADAASTADVAGLRTMELTAVLGADVVLTHSSHEAALLADLAPEANVRLVAWDVPLRPFAVPIAARSGVAFVGGYGHPPNQDAARYLLDQVMPLVWAEAPAIPLLLAGSEMPTALRARAEAVGERVEVLGQVPDLAEVWARVRLSVAPLRFGAGLKGKVLDSLAAGIPCVCSPVAAEGMAFPDALAALVAEGPEAIARMVLRLHTDELENLRLSEVALIYVAEHYSAERITAALGEAFSAAIGSEPSIASDE
jgi:glycosyltransferase involved in cell wall biosynthesis